MDHLLGLKGFLICPRAIDELVQLIDVIEQSEFWSAFFWHAVLHRWGVLELLLSILLIEEDFVHIFKQKETVGYLNFKRVAYT